MLMQRCVSSKTRQKRIALFTGTTILLSEKELEKFDVHAVCYPFSELKEKGSIGYIEEGQYTIEQPEPFNMEQEDTFSYRQA